VRRFAGGLLIEQQNTYRKRLEILEQEERNLKSRIRKLESEATTVRKERWMAALPGLLVGLILFGLTRAASRRQVAS